MPGRDGWETLALLRAVAPTVRVLFVSGGGALHSAARGVRPASDGVRFLRKPFDWAALREAMDALLDHPT
jgi:DNA-binding response OmpR family regulator